MDTLWGSKWKCENHGFPHRNHRFHVYRGSPETSCAALCAQCFPTCFSERLFLDLLSIWSPEGPGEVPQRTHTSCTAPCAQCFQMCFSEGLFFNLLSIWIAKGVPGEVPQRTHEPLLRLLFPTCLLWEPIWSPGSPKHARDHQCDSKIDSKMTPRGCQNDIQNTRK